MKRHYLLLLKICIVFNNLIIITWHLILHWSSIPIYKSRGVSVYEILQWELINSLLSIWHSDKRFRWEFHSLSHRGVARHQVYMVVLKKRFEIRSPGFFSSSLFQRSTLSGHTNRRLFLHGHYTVVTVADRVSYRKTSYPDCLLIKVRLLSHFSLQR